MYFLPPLQTDRSARGTIIQSGELDWVRRFVIGRLVLERDYFKYNNFAVETNPLLPDKRAK